jgi:hypothetical protein
MKLENRTTLKHIDMLGISIRFYVGVLLGRVKGGSGERSMKTIIAMILPKKQRNCPSALGLIRTD